MKEGEFRDLLEKAWKKGRVPQISAVPLDDGHPVAGGIGRYIGGHALLPQGYEEIPINLIADMGKLLFQKGVSSATKEAVMMLLAHHGCDEALDLLREYRNCADPQLEIFAELALQECVMWNEDLHSNAC